MNLPCMHKDFYVGLRDSLPFHLGGIPYGLITGIAAVEAGLTLEQAVGMSVIVFAGASQLAAMELLAETAPLAVIVGTAAIINIRLIMYSASIAPYFARRSRFVRAAAAYLLTDQAYAMSVMEFDSDRSRDRFRYYLGLGGSIWTIYVLSTAIGVVVGANVPPELELSFTVPLIFLALLVPVMKDRSTIMTGAVGGLGALVGASAPFNIGLLLGALAGITAGLTVESLGGP
jgi:predicted branched-subunit amino acid permease